ncbi:hypothetical protein NP493_683g02030 [Ridgeia piscesae]|uniref:Fanconi anemia group I protein n=1 Tax=Ridgeia piscesae TaxID=27915 RepID=A0AAD9KRL0_RIDPI|nr:hypothetical protein NP493_683g02030 [Ridgeia piscesae]
MCVYKQCVSLLHGGQLTSKDAAELVGLLMLETDAFPAPCLAELTDMFVDAIKNDLATNGKALELFPKLLSTLEAQDVVSYNDSVRSGVEQKSHVLNSLCSSRWDPSQAIHLVTMFRDVSLLDSELRFVITKVIRLFKDLDLQELPPLIYQLLLLAAKGHKRLVLEGIIDFFVKQDELFEIEQKNSDDDGLSTATGCVDQLQQIEGTVILHVTFAIKLNQELGRELVKYLKAQQQLSGSQALAPFSVALALSVSRIQRFEDQIYDFLKSAILKSFKDRQRKQESAWVREMAPEGSSAAELILRTTQNSALGWDNVTQGLVQLGFILMDTFGPKAAFGKVVEAVAPSGAETPNQKVCHLGSEILLNTFKIHDVVRQEIIEQILNRVVTKTTSPVSHFIALLSKTVMSAPQVMLDMQPKVREAFDYLPLLPMATAHGLLSAILPLMKISTTLKDSLSLVLKKAMFSRQVESRRIAVGGYLLMLRHFRVLGGSTCSQATQSLSLSQVHVDVHLRYNPASNESLCLEILGNLRRCLSQQAPVRLTLYEGLYEVVHRNSQLANPVLGVLLAQLKLYYEAEEDVTPPLKLAPCVTAQGGTDVFLVEPLTHLLACITQCVLTTNSLASGDDEDDDDESSIVQTEIRQILQSLTRRMLKSDLEDFELDKEADFTTSSGVGVRNNIFALLLSGLYEILIEYNLSVSDFEFDRYEEAAQLFCGYQKLNDILKSPEKTGAGGGGKKSRPATTSVNSGGATNKNKSLLSLRFVSTLLESVLGDDLPAHQRCLDVLRQNSCFMRYIVNVALQKVQQVSDRGSCDGPGGSDGEKLFKYVTSISRVLLRHYKEELHNLPEATEQKKERTNRQMALLCLEGIVTIVGIVCGRYPEKLTTFLLALEGRSDTGEQDEGEAAQPTYIHHHIKLFQRMVVTTMTADGEDRRLKEAMLLLSTISLLCKQLPPEGAEFGQVLHWTQRLCTEQTPDDSTVTKVLLALLLQLTRPAKSVLPVTRDLARDIHVHLGDIDQAVQVEGASIYSVVTARTAAPVTLLLVLGQIDRELDDTEWSVNRLRMDTLTVVNGNDSQGTQQEEKEKSAITRLGHMINSMHELVQSATPAGVCAENVVKTLTHLYGALSLVTKYYISLYQQKLGHLPSRFEKLVRLSGTGLTQLVYAMITYMQAAQSDTIQQAKDDGKKKKTSASAVVGKARVLKEMRTIPNLIFAIEQYEKFLIQLSKKSKINLMEHIKLSTSRDFRINMTVLQELTEQTGDTSSDDDDDDTTLDQASFFQGLVSLTALEAHKLNLH